MSRQTTSQDLAIDIIDSDPARTDEVVRRWRESFEFGVGVIDINYEWIASDAVL